MRRAKKRMRWVSLSNLAGSVTNAGPTAQTNLLSNVLMTETFDGEVTLLRILGDIVVRLVSMPQAVTTPNGIVCEMSIGMGTVDETGTLTNYTTPPSMFGSESGAFSWIWGRSFIPAFSANSFPAANTNQYLCTPYSVSSVPIINARSKRLLKLGSTLFLAVKAQGLPVGQSFIWDMQLRFLFAFGRK